MLHCENVVFGLSALAFLSCIIILVEDTGRLCNYKIPLDFITFTRLAQCRQQDDMLHVCGEKVKCGQYYNGFSECH